MQNEIEARLRQGVALEASGKPEQAAAIYITLLDRLPNLISAHLRLSEVWQQLDKYRKSRTSAMLAANSLVRTQRWEALPFVTTRLLSFGERPRIRELIMEADWKHPAVISQSPVLSQHLWLAEAYEESIAFISQVGSRIPDNAKLSYSRANALRYCGRMDEATEELERCLALSPNFPFAHWTLAHHAPSATPGTRVDRIRRAMGTLASDHAAQTYLNYALFKELDDADDTEAAWQALAEGARLKRVSIDFDSAQEGASFGAIREAALAAGPVGGRGAAVDHVPVFVVGMPRTGTTLMERILSNHSDVASGGEMGDFVQTLSWSMDRFVASPPSPEVAGDLGCVDYIALGERYRSRTAENARGRGFLVDKNPLNVFHAWSIAKALPEARVVCLLREPMDACFSNLKELFSGAGYGYSYSFEELAAHQRGFAQTVRCWQALIPEQFMTVRYEDLVADPERIAEDVSRFCGMRAREGLTEITKNNTPVFTASSSQVKQPIHTRNVGGWTRYSWQLQSLTDAIEPYGALDHR